MPKNLVFVIVAVIHNCVIVIWKLLYYHLERPGSSVGVVVTVSQVGNHLITAAALNFKFFGYHFSLLLLLFVLICLICASCAFFWQFL